MLECFACSSDVDNCVDIAHANNIFRVIVSAHAHLFLIQALNVSSLLLARTTSHNVAIAYLTRQNEKIQQKLIALLETSESSETASKEDVRQMLLLKNVVVTQRLNALQQRPLPGVELIQNDISAQIGEKLLPNCRLASLFLYYFNMNSFRIWRKPMEVRDMNASTSQYHQIPIQVQNAPPADHVTTHNGTTTFHTTASHTPRLCEGSLAPGCSTSLADASAHRKREMAEQKRELTGGQTNPSVDDYFVRKTNGRLGLTIYAHNEDGVIRAEVRGVTSFAPRCAQVGDSVIAVDAELISSVRCASDVEKLLRVGKVIHLRRKTPLPVAKTPDTPLITKKTGCGKLAMALHELLITEKKYVADLKEMNDVFLCMRQVRDIMHAAIRLYKMQLSFVESLEEAIGDITRQDISTPQIRDSVMRVCAVFINKCADFKIYAEYAAGYHLLQHEIKTKKELLSKLEAVNSTREQHCSWESRMIKPVQRIVQYPLLLKTIADALPKEARERAQVDAALQKMQTNAEYVNEMQRLNEDYAHCIESVRRAHEAMLTEKGLRLDTRELLVFAHIKWRDAPAEHYVVFVFHSLILLLPSYARKEIKMKWTRVLPINEVDINEMPNDALNLKLYHAAFEGANGQLSHSNPNTVYHIECCQSQLKQHLIKNIKKARAAFSRESHRPLSGSSQSDGGYVSEVSKDHRNSK
uniref:DH domain-containing protein n=1 Tax=Caenorhabditis japonica TaxID=281687 RepID=A0A8R1DRM7_CAEJA